ncbi:hypothetical protein P3396_23130, partial [Vibrio parahaemolyticus]|nr:hypothetical protein [Vibrio parahaemolyticus]
HLIHLKQLQGTLTCRPHVYNINLIIKSYILGGATKWFELKNTISNIVNTVLHYREIQNRTNEPSLI